MRLMTWPDDGGARCIASVVMEVYLTGLSHRLNEVMKTLTIIATIMMPLSVIVGIYGMNFRHMPELESPYGYPLVLIAMLLIAGGMLLFFRHRRWF
ncbi:MAG: CorA family divalent cation transporter [Bacteroidota bacterium]